MLVCDELWQLNGWFLWSVTSGVIPYYRMKMGEKEEIVKVLYVAGDFLASGGVHDSSDFFSITISG